MADSFPTRPRPPLSNNHITAVPPMNAPQSVSDFRFSVIGQQPPLLQRISAPTADLQMHDESDIPSRSPSPDLEHELLPSSPELKGTSRPSLRARLALDPPSTGGSQPQSLERDVEQSMLQSRNAQRPSTENIPPRTESFDQKSSVEIVPSASRAQVLSPGSGPSSVSDTAKKSMIAHDKPATATQIVPAQSLPNSIVNTEDNNATIDSLKEIQVRLASVVENLNPVDIENALAIARSVKNKCSEVHSSARDAHMHAESALQSAQKSIDAARRCFELATSLETHTDDVITSINRLSQTSSPRGRGNWNTTLDALKQDLRTLSQWTQKREAEDARLRSIVEEKAVLRAAHANKAPQNGPNSNTNQSLNPADSSIPQNCSDATNSSQSMDEDDNTREWNRLREQNETEMKAIEEKLQRHKQEEALLEQKRAQALAEAEAKKAELIRRQAERSEFERQLQIQQMQKAQLAEKMRLKQEETQRKANEERLAQTARVKDQSSRLQAEKEKQVLLKIEQEKAQALGKRRLGEEERMQRLKKEQEIKRLQIAETKRQSAAETAKEINANRQSLKSHDLISNTRAAPFVSAPTLPEDGPKTSGISSSKLNKTEARIIPVVQNQNLRDMIDSSAGHSAPDSKINDHSHVVNLPTSPLVADMGLTQPDKIKDTSSLPRKPESFVASSIPTAGINSPGTPKHGRLPSLPTLASIGKDRSPVSHPANKLGLSSSVRPRGAILPLKPETKCSDISVLSQGRDSGNIPYVPQSRILPISPEAQRANLRNLMADIPQSKHNPADVDVKPVIKAEELFNVSASSKPILGSVQRDNLNVKRDSIDLPQKPKVEPVDDIPFLSIPSSSQAIAMHDNLRSPHLATVNEKTKERRTDQERSPKPTTLLQPLQPSYLVKANAHVNDSESAQGKPTTISGHRDTQSALISSLPSRPVPVASTPHMRTSNMPNVANMSRNNYFDEFDGMGNDPSITSGWNQPNDDDEDISVRRSSEEGHSGGVNRYSPPSPPRASNFNRNPLVSRRGRGRRVDHYSPPRRSPRPGSPYNRYSAEPLDRGRRSPNLRDSTSANNSRGASPDTRPYNARPMSPPSPPLNQTAGRKRTRDDIDNGGPPNRRLRYQNQESARYASTSARPPRVSPGNQFEEEWSHAAEYGRSPSPRRNPPLQARLDDWGNGPVATQESSHLGGKLYNYNKHSGKTKGIDEPGARSLLNRLSDGDHPSSALPHSGTNRGPPRHRNSKHPPRATHQVPEYRTNTNKGNLIDRLQGDP